MRIQRKGSDILVGVWIDLPAAPHFPTKSWMDSYPYAEGTYCLFLDKRLIYVGASDNLFGRLHCHFMTLCYVPDPWRLRCSWGEGRTAHFKFKMAKRRGDAWRLEKRLIDRLRPPLNKPTKRQRQAASMMKEVACGNA